jgi:hypothetical protein
MSVRQIAPVACAVLGLGLAACGGGDGDGGGDNLAIGQEAVVEHTQSTGGAGAPKTTIGVTVLKVRKGTQAELKAGGFTLDPEEQAMTPYYVDARYANKGSAAVKDVPDVSLEDEDGNLISGTVIISLGGPPFDKCPKNDDDDLDPGESQESCTLFLVGEGKEPKRVSFLPYNPSEETEFVYWSVE